MAVVRAHAMDDLDRLGIEGMSRVRAIVQLAAVVEPPSDGHLARFERQRQQTANVATASGPAAASDATTAKISLESGNGSERLSTEHHIPVAQSSCDTTTNLAGGR
jgi:hypothetical protein